MFFDLFNSKVDKVKFDRNGHQTLLEDELVCSINELYYTQASKFSAINWYMKVCWNEALA